MVLGLGHQRRIMTHGQWLFARTRISTWSLFHSYLPPSLRSTTTSTLNDATSIVRSCESSWPNESTSLRSKQSWLQWKLETGMSFLETLTTDFTLASLCVATPTGNVYNASGEQTQPDNVLDGQQFLLSRSLSLRGLLTFHRSLISLGLTFSETSA